MPVPQRMTVVTLGARSVPSLRAFYSALGWAENDGSDETYTSFTMGSLRLALYPIDLLGKEAAPRDDVVASDAWNGVTLGVNVATREGVDDAFAAAVAAGAEAIESPVERSWGGYSGYFADPEGHRWELAWAPWFTTFDQRGIVVPGQVVAGRRDTVKRSASLAHTVPLQRSLLERVVGAPDRRIEGEPEVPFGVHLGGCEGVVLLR